MLRQCNCKIVKRFLEDYQLSIIHDVQGNSVYKAKNYLVFLRHSNCMENCLPFVFQCVHTENQINMEHCKFLLCILSAILKNLSPSSLSK